MIRSCAWNHEDLPYKPASPCLLLYLVPGNPLPRVTAPNARGEFPELVPGLPYLEWRCTPTPLHECAPPPAE